MTWFPIEYPPSRRICAPVTCAEAEEERNSAIPARSCGTPTRPTKLSACDFKFVVEEEITSRLFGCHLIPFLSEAECCHAGWEDPVRADYEVSLYQNGSRQLELTLVE